MDTSTPASPLVFSVLVSLAQFERRIMPTRQREGIAKAKAEGKYKGWAPTARAKAAEVSKLFAEGVSAVKRQGGLGLGGDLCTVFWRITARQQPATTSGHSPSSPRARPVSAGGAPKWDKAQ